MSKSDTVSGKDATLLCVVTQQKDTLSKEDAQVLLDKCESQFIKTVCEVILGFKKDNIDAEIAETVEYMLKWDAINKEEGRRSYEEGLREHKLNCCKCGGRDVAPEKPYFL